MFGQRLRRWPNIKPALGQRLIVNAGKSKKGTTLVAEESFSDDKCVIRTSVMTSSTYTGASWSSSHEDGDVTNATGFSYHTVYYVSSFCCHGNRSCINDGQGFTKFMFWSFFWLLLFYWVFFSKFILTFPWPNTRSLTENGGGPGAVVKAASQESRRSRGQTIPWGTSFKKTKSFFPAHSNRFHIVGSLRDREVACWASDRQGSNFESCVWRSVASHSSQVLITSLSAQSWQ